MPADHGTATGSAARARFSPRDLGRIIWEALNEWINDSAMRLSASLAMYTILSLSPLLVITVKVISVVLEEDAASRQIARQVAALLGPLGAAALNDMIVEASRRGAGVLATAISSGILLVTASGVFAELQGALNTVWRVRSVPAWNVLGWLKNRLLSMAMVIAVGFLLLVSQALTTALTMASEVFAGGAGWMSFAVDTTASLIVITAVFALLYRILPDVKMEWHDVLLAAVVTAALFKAGQYLLALYFAHGATTSAYGAAGSFVALLLWVYYSCWIVFFGAEFTKVYARHRGRWVEPEEFATKADPHDDGTPVLPGSRCSAPPRRRSARSRAATSSTAGQSVAAPPSTAVRRSSGGRRWCGRPREGSRLRRFSRKHNERAWRSRILASIPEGES